MNQQHNVAKKKLKKFLFRQRQDTIKIVGNLIAMEDLNTIVDMGRDGDIEDNMNL